MKKLILIFFTILISFGCRENKKNEESKHTDTAPTPEVQEDDLLKVIINARVLVDDVFEVYYYELGEETFHSKDFVLARVKGSPENQDIVFTMPERTYPERLRLDFGKNKNQKPIELNSVILKYNEKEYIFSTEEVNALTPSKFMEYNSNNKTISTKEIDGRYDPYFYTQKVSSIVNYLLED